LFFWPKAKSTPIGGRLLVSAAVEMLAGNIASTRAAST